MVARSISKYCLVFATLSCLATLPAAAQNTSTAQGGGSFRVQCPQYTPLHPGPGIAPATYPTPTTSAQDQAQNYVGPVSYVENVPDVPNPGNLKLAYPPVPLTFISNGGAIKCQEISGGDGMMTEADGNQTFMFSFGPLSGLDNIKHGQPGTLINSEFNGSIDPTTGNLMLDSSGNPINLYYNSPLLPSVCGPAAPSNCSTAGAAGISTSNYGGNPITDPTFDPNKKLPSGNPYINTNAGIADPATIMTVGVIDGNIPMPMAAFDEDDEFFLTLSNVGMIMRPDLFEQHTVHFHGYPNASSYYDGVPDATWAINIGGSATYYYLAPDAGTYFYHCHITPPEHLQMGMVGQLYVRPRQNRVPLGMDLYKSVVGCVGNPSGCSGPGATNPGQQSDQRTACNTSSVLNQDILCSAPLPASDNGFTQIVDPFAGTDPRIPAGTRLKYVYNDGDGSTWYDIDAPMQIHGFDPNFHFVGMTFNAEGFSDMKDKYFLLNGRSYPDTVGVPGYCDPSGCGGPSVAAATTAGSPDPASHAIGTEDTDGRTRFSQPLPSLITLYQGERALLRLSDLDVLEYQTLASLGIPMQLVGFQAKLLRDQAGNNLPITTNSINIGGGESVDVILDSCLVRGPVTAGSVPACTTPIPKGTYFLYTTNLDHLSNDAENFGGLMTEVVIQ
jgi:FtsP/CotA-like multicopper oxidase with cupredoxin domain